MAKTTAIYGHLAGDGIAHVSFDVDYAEIEQALGEQITERVETEWISEWHDEVEKLTPEPERETAPPRIGTLEYTPGNGYEIEIEPAMICECGTFIPPEDAPEAWAEMEPGCGTCNRYKRLYQKGQLGSITAPDS